MRTLSRFLPLLLIALGPAACGGGGGAAAPTDTATLHVMLTDTPFADAQAVLVTFSGVSVHLSGGDWVSLPFAGGAATRTCDLKRLVGAQDVLGTGPLQTGHYTQIRLDVASGALYFDAGTSGDACSASLAAPGGRTAALTVPSGEVRLNREFDLTAGNATTVTLDFDGDSSIHLAGTTYMMQPVIAVVSVQ
jgi:hypothetical protein